MNVREMINELLEFDMDANLDVYITSSHEDDSFDFTITSDSTYKRNVSLEVNLEKYVLVDKREFEDMEIEIETLADELEDLRNE